MQIQLPDEWSWWGVGMVLTSFALVCALSASVHRDVEQQITDQIQADSVNFCHQFGRDEVVCVGKLRDLLQGYDVSQLKF